MNTQGLRIAAARLAALHPGDRAWLLKQLPVEHARALQRVLRSPELKRWSGQLGELEIPAPAIAAAETEATVTQAALPAALKQVDPAWIALWLAAHQPEDRDVDLDSLGVTRARKVREEAARLIQPLSPSLRAALAQWPGKAGSFAEWL
ncbi:hypothetical protein FHW84_003487 [Dyella sp. SG562]|uniref:hypothetical protein n=1 Tax=Dyella sp. SG562 TaxID=2587017 RepID=UPI00141E43B4|nr:hypothetical protein [Dyella sp. SG562]NII74890.1 hypothetical protein [Dyella sp. SG562]